MSYHTKNETGGSLDMSAAKSKADTAGTPDGGKRAHAEEIIRRLRQGYPDARIVLHFRNDWELLVAVILSAQCTDKMVNQVTEKLFRKYHTIEDYAGATWRSSRSTYAPPGSSGTRPSTSSGRRRSSSDFGGEVTLQHEGI